MRPVLPLLGELGLPDRGVTGLGGRRVGVAELEPGRRDPVDQQPLQGGHVASTAQLALQCGYLARQCLLQTEVRPGREGDPGVLGVPPEVNLVVKAVVVFAVMLLQSPEFRATVGSLVQRRPLPGEAA